MNSDAATTRIRFALGRVEQARRERNAATAREYAAVREFAREHAQAERAAGRTDAAELDASVIAQLGLALQTPPSRARQALRIARDLHRGLDHVRALFAAGLLCERRVGVIVTATAHLDAAERARVDTELAGRTIERLGVGRVRHLTQTLAAQTAPAKLVAQRRAARAGRHVGVRPGQDGMAWLTAHLPAEQAVACYAGLVAEANRVAVAPEPTPH